MTAAKTTKIVTTPAELFASLSDSVDGRYLDDFFNVFNIYWSRTAIADVADVAAENYVSDCAADTSVKTFVNGSVYDNDPRALDALRNVDADMFDSANEFMNYVAEVYHANTVSDYLRDHLGSYAVLAAARCIGEDCSDDCTLDVMNVAAATALANAGNATPEDITSAMRRE